MIIIYKEITHDVNQTYSSHNCLVIPVSPQFPDGQSLEQGWAGPANNFNQQSTHCLGNMTNKSNGNGNGKNPVPLQAASSSSHPRPSASSLSLAIGLNIFCLFHPDDNPSQHIFSVTLHSDWTIDGMKKAIKQERGNDLKDINAVKLILYKVLISTAIFRHTALSLLLLVAWTPDSWQWKYDWRAEEQGLCYSRTTMGYTEVVHYILKWCWGRTSTHFGAKIRYMCYMPSVIMTTIPPSHWIATADQQPTKWRHLDEGDNEEGQIDWAPGEY